MPDSEESPDPRRWKALTVCLIAGFMTLLDVSIVNVALPSIRTGLHASQADLQWVLSGYSLTFGLLLVPAGRLGDARGRRRIFVIGVIGFTLSSAVAGISPNSLVLVFARLVQGAAGGMVNPQVSGLIQQMFRGAERGRAFGLLGASIGISTAVGPLLGGLLIAAAGATDGWRWVFYVNLPIGVVAVILAFRFIPAELGHRAAEHLDPIGVLLLGAGVVAVLLPLIESREMVGAWLWALVPIGLALLVGFWWWERRYGRDHTALVNFGLFRHRSYAFGVPLAVAYFAAFTPVFFVFTLFVQTGLHDSALRAGVAVTPFAIGSASAAAIGGRIVTRIGRPLVVYGLIAVAIGLAGSAVAVELVPGQNAVYATALPLLVAGIGSGLVISPNQTLTLSQVPPVEAGSAGGVLQTGQRVGGAFGVAVAGSLFFSEVAKDPQGFASAYERAIWTSVGFVAVALVIAIFDVIMHRRATSGERTPSGQPQAPGT